MKGLTDLPQDMGFCLVQDVCQGGILFYHTHGGSVQAGEVLTSPCQPVGFYPITKCPERVLYPTTASWVIPGLRQCREPSVALY